MGSASFERGHLIVHVDKRHQFRQVTHWLEDDLRDVFGFVVFSGLLRGNFNVYLRYDLDLRDLLGLSNGLGDTSSILLSYSGLVLVVALALGLSAHP